jgi:hypothetical protein
MKERPSKLKKAAVKLIVHYNCEAHDRDNIRKFLENCSTPLVTIIVTNVKNYK